MRRLLLLAAPLALFACSPAPQKPQEAPEAAAPAPEPEPSDGVPREIALTLADCAGAMAVLTNLDPIKQTHPVTDSDDENFYWLLLALLDKEENFEGEAGRLAAASARAAWTGAAPDDLQSHIAACRARYAPH